MVNMDPEFERRHGNYYASIRPDMNRGRISAPGMQYLVHLLKGGYLGEDFKDGSGKAALDVGCGSGFNSVTLAMMGWDVDACEINEEIVQHARANIKQYGFDIDVQVGENERLPYRDESFHLLLSINVIHYLPGESAVRRTVREYARVLKKGGRLIVSTNHPSNWILQGHEKVGSNMVRIRQPGDYRDGQVLFLFSSREMLSSYFSDHFEKVITGENRFDFFTRTVRNLLLTGIKG